MYFVLFCLQVHEDESITEGLKCVGGGGGRGRGNVSVGAYKQQQVYGILTMSAAMSSSS